MKAGNWQTVKNIIVDYLKSAAIKAALLKFLGSTVAGGWKAWLVKFIVTELFEEVAEPIIRLGLRKMGYVYNRIEGEIELKKLERAKEEGDEQSYNDVIDDL